MKDFSSSFIVHRRQTTVHLLIRTRCVYTLYSRIRTPKLVLIRTRCGCYIVYSRIRTPTDRSRMHPLRIRTRSRIRTYRSRIRTYTRVYAPYAPYAAYSQEFISDFRHPLPSGSREPAGSREPVPEPVPESAPGGVHVSGGVHAVLRSPWRC